MCFQSPLFGALEELVCLLMTSACLRSSQLATASGSAFPSVQCLLASSPSRSNICGSYLPERAIVTPSSQAAVTFEVNESKRVNGSILTNGCIQELLSLFRDKNCPLFFRQVCARACLLTLLRGRCGELTQTGHVSSVGEGWVENLWTGFANVSAGGIP